MTSFKAKTLVELCLISTFLTILSTPSIAYLGQQDSPDIVGAPASPSHVDNGNRHPKPNSGPTKSSSGCNEGGCEDKSKKTSAAPATTKTPQQIAEEEKARVLQMSEQELWDASRALVLEIDEKPLERPLDALSDWLSEKLENKLTPERLGPVVQLLEALEPDTLGKSYFDRFANDKEKIQALRALLELEERELKKKKEENAEAYEKNLELLFPPVSTEIEVNRTPASLEKQARFENALKALAKVRSDDLSVVADHILRRTKPDAPIRMTYASVKETETTLAAIAPANACQVAKNYSCVMFGAEQGKKCFCPEFPLGYKNKPVIGSTVRQPVGRYCRSGDASSEMHMAFPLGTSCLVPVDLTFDPFNPHFEYLKGYVVKEKCDTYGDREFNPACQAPE